MARWKLKNLRPHEISLVAKPAFTESEWLVLKSLMVAFDRLAFSGKPVHPWHHIQQFDEDATDVCLLVTAIILQAGDKKSDGSEYTAEEVAALQALWCRRRNRERNGGYQYIHNPGESRPHDQFSGALNTDALVTNFGITGDKDGLKVMGAGGKGLPKHCWWLQMIATNDQHDSASKIVGDRRIFNGLKLVKPAVLLKADGDEDWPTPPAGFRQVAGDDDRIDLAEAGAALGRIVVDTIEEVQNPQMTPEEVGEGLGLAALEGLGLKKAEADELDAAAAGRELGAVAIKTIEDICKD